MRATQNELVTRVGPGTACGALLRRYWQPVALVDEFNPAFHPEMALRQVKAVRVLGEDFVLFKDAQGRFALFDRACPHRGADLSFGRDEGDGLRCPFHGWKFATSGQCLQTPGEPAGSRLCESVRARSHPLQVQGGVVFAWLGPQDSAPTHLPALDAFAAPASHSFAFKGLWQANWLQAVEVGIDPAHPSFLHRMLQDAPLDEAANYGRQFRNASAGAVAGQRWPMTRVMREVCAPDIHFDMASEGQTQITTLRRIDEQTLHVRVTQSLFPQTFVIPLSETITITQWHVPVDDENTYWYSFFTSFAAPLDKLQMREQRARHMHPDGRYAPLKGRHNGWGFDAQEQRERTFLGMGEDDINVHDQWAVESMGPIADRSRERLGQTDKVILHNRRLLVAAIERVAQGGDAPLALKPEAAAALTGPHTWDGFAPSGSWQAFWLEQARSKRASAPWAAAPVQRP